MTASAGVRHKLDNIADWKTALRREMGDRRRRVLETERAGASGAACARLLNLPEVKAATASHDVVAGFAATPFEIDPAAALREVRRLGGRVAYPRVTDAPPRLRLHVADGEVLRPGRFGIREPDAALPEIAPRDMAVIIVPGLAFDPRGYRLGFGGGYYDELLDTVAGSARPLLVAVAFEFQIVDECPVDDHDLPVDVIVTESRVLRCTPPSDPGDSVAPAGNGRGTAP